MEIDFSFFKKIFKFRQDLSLGHIDSLVVVWPQQLPCGLSCSTACENLAPQTGIEPESSAKQGGFLTTGPPGKSQSLCSEVVILRAHV